MIVVLIKTGYSWDHSYLAEKRVICLILNYWSAPVFLGACDWTCLAIQPYTIARPRKESISNNAAAPFFGSLAPEII